MYKEIYLDNNATTKIDNDVYEAMLPYLKEEYGNPSSIYNKGVRVREKIEDVRDSVAKLIGADKDEIVFTSCASEANVTAIMNVIKNSDKKHIITTKVEHSSILETMKYLESIGYDVTYLSVDTDGRLDIDELKKEIREDTCLIAVMMANNEIGNIYDIEEIGKIAREYNILFHVDTVQAIGKIKVDVNKLNIDTLSIAGHKIHAPKGIGVLYVRKDIPFTSLIFGHQENNRRGGTENVPYIIGLGVAVNKIIEDDYKEIDNIRILRDYMEDEIVKKIDDVKIYGDKSNRLANTSSIAFLGVNAEELMILLESFNIYVSTGSACNTRESEPSHVLRACKVDLENYSPIRISLSKYNTKNEINEFVRNLIIAVKCLRKK